MRYFLMHKDIQAALVEINEQGELTKIIDVLEPTHFPFGTASKKGERNPSGLIRWWNNRRIPMSRDDLKKIRGLVLPEGASTRMLLLRCYGLSLSDSFWIRPEKEEISFSDLDFFENEYSYDLGDALVGKSRTEVKNLMSPDATSEGNLKKRWKIINGTRVLLKSGTPPYYYEVFNEVIASAVCQALAVPHTPYSLFQDSEGVYCACPDFISYGQDFVTANMILKGLGKRNDESSYSFFLRAYKELGVENPEKEIGQMLLVDFLLGNEDRHLNNFGLIRDAKSLAFLGVAPLFDTGSSLGYAKSDQQLASLSKVPWKPFASRSHPTQLDYLKNIDWLSPDALLSIPSVVGSLIESFGNAIPQARKEAMVCFVSHNVNVVAKRFGLEKGFETALNAVDRAILEYASGKIIANAAICAAKIGVSAITALRHLEKLASLGLLKRVGSRKTGHWVAK